MRLRWKLILPVAVRRTSRFALGAVAALLAAGPAAGQSGEVELAVMGTIPLYWGEVDGLADVLAGQGMPHWARAELEREWQLVPLDYLSAAALAPFRRLLLAQPRGLTGEENVALDGWVRGGGQLLLFADPQMTGESRFGIGDRRRPQDVALLSPILAHWGLELRFDGAANRGLRDVAGLALPVNQPGHYAINVPPPGPCSVQGEGVLAECRLGAGRVTLLADAALLDLHDPATGACAALAGLLRLAFGENASPPATMARESLENAGISAHEAECGRAFSSQLGAPSPP